MHVTRSALLTKLSEQDAKESFGLKTKQSNADLIPILPDQFTRNDNKTLTDTSGKKINDEIQIDANIEMLENSNSNILVEPS